MNTTCRLGFAWGLALALGWATMSNAAPMEPLKGSLSGAGRYVPVSLDGCAADNLGAGLAGPHVTLRGVPFELVGRPGADNLFLKSAEWPDWEKDPSAFYAAYDSGAQPGDPQRPMLKVPVADYSAVYLLAAADNDKALSQAVSFRIGAFRGGQRTTLHDFTATIPRLEEKRAAGTMATLPTPAGNVYLVRVPLGLAFAQDFSKEWALDVEVTKELRLAIRRPDPCRYQYRPLGLPSGVHILAMTFERAPVQMEVTTAEAGHVFNEPQVPTFRVSLRSLADRPESCTVEATATDLDGKTTAAGPVEVALSPTGPVAVELPVKVARLGWYSLVVSAKVGKGDALRRETTFALLAPDTRKHRDQSPFGVWDFCGTHFTPSDPGVVGPLYVKAGLRYGMFSFSPEARRKYGVLAGNEPNSPDALAKRLAEDPQTPHRVLIFHEHAISGPHIMRTPDLFTGRSPYQLDEKEHEKFDALWKQALDTAAATRKQFPDARIYFGNGAPQLLEEFLRHKLPKDAFDFRGNEAGSFMRMPESQPLDFVSNNAALWMDRQLLDAYGYADKPIAQCYEICYPSTNPGNLTPRTQASYLVRHVMHSLAWGVPVIRPSLICDVGNSYYFSNWGASGLCCSMPDVRPKPSYVAFAVLTQMLDGARFSRVVPAGSTTLYAMEFRRPDGSFLTALWTLRGTRPLALSLPGVREATAVDLMGNKSRVAVAGGKAGVVASTDPIYLATARPIAAIAPGVPELPGRPAGKSFVISSLGSLADWKVESERSLELEFYNFECPRRKGDFAYREVPVYEGEQNVLQVSPKLPVPGSPYLPMYSVLAHTTGVEIPGEPTEIGLMVNGNGGWGRIIFELEDASGQRWTSIGAATTDTPTRWMEDWLSPAELARMRTQPVGDWNTNDPWRRSSITWDGWSYLRFPLPGNYPGEGYHWPYSSQWRCTGDGVVKYPLRFRKLIVELPEKVLHVRDYAAPARREIYLKDLMVTYGEVPAGA